MSRLLKALQHLEAKATPAAPEQRLPEPTLPELPSSMEMLEEAERTLSSLMTDEQLSVEEPLDMATDESLDQMPSPENAPSKEILAPSTPEESGMTQESGTTEDLDLEAATEVSEDFSIPKNAAESEAIPTERESAGEFLESLRSVPLPQPIKADRTPQPEPKETVGEESTPTITEAATESVETPTVETTAVEEPSLLMSTLADLKEAGDYGQKIRSKRILDSVCVNILSRVPHSNRAMMSFAAVDDNSHHALAVEELATGMAARLEDPVLMLDAASGGLLSQKHGAAPAYGLGDLAEGKVDWKDLIVQTRTPGLCLLPIATGLGSAENPITIARLLSQINTHYATVLIDAGCCDGALSGSLQDACDGSFLIVHARKTPNEEALLALQHLASYRPPVLGCVLLQTRE